MLLTHSKQTHNDSLNMFNMFEDFLVSESPDMFITGMAGTGKTTYLKRLVEYCNQNNLKYCVCAYTHKAVSVLKEKVDNSKDTCTLHSFLAKMPRIDQDATGSDVSKSIAKTTKTSCGIVFIDEFSMVGTSDIEDIETIRKCSKVKFVFLGDENQLPPVKEAKAMKPQGDYIFKLTKIHRQSDGNPLIDDLIKLNNYIDEGRVIKDLRTILSPHRSLEYSKDLVKSYKDDPSESKVVLAYTNMAVQNYNRCINGKNNPDVENEVFNVSTQERLTIKNLVNSADIVELKTPHGDIINKNSKFQPLKYIVKFSYLRYALVENAAGNQNVIAYVFGVKNYSTILEQLTQDALTTNKDILREIKCASPKQWAETNRSHPLAEARLRAWKEFMTFRLNVHCLDFHQAMTIHKSQGSTFENVYIDIDNLNTCKDNITKLKLLYVAISRASEKVIVR